MMLAFMGTWPSVAVYGLVGAICGAIGALLGGLLGKRWPKLRTILVVIGFVSSRYVTELVVLPQIQNDYANADLPKQIDTITSLERIFVDGKNVHYFYRLSDTTPLTPGETMKAGIAPGACSFWKPKFQSDEIRQAVYDYTFKEGHSSFVLTSGDCK
jgi:hypothetical protein